MIMAPKVFVLFSFILILLFVQSHAVLSHSHDQKASAFEFIKHLQGCHKGDKVKGLHELKKYLQKFGYLTENSHSNNQTQSIDNDDFDDLLESAIKTYQLNYHLKVTGALDAKTASKMMSPRCGVPDIVNGTNWMRSGKKRHNHHGHDKIHKVSHFAFFDGNPRWQKTHLTYGFLPNTPAEAMDPVARAFNQWASATSYFTFSRAQDYTSADITIGFASGNHGDGDINSFDGFGGTIAHAFPPTDGRFHYDAADTWSVGVSPGVNDLETVALHEIGHLLGLDHSSEPGAIMEPIIPQGVTKGLHADDIQGIKALYGI